MEHTPQNGTLTIEASNNPIFTEIVIKDNGSGIKKEDLPHDIRLERVISYIESSYSRKTSVEELARLANMSVSRFFPYFKNEFGVTPIDYINSYRVGRAIILLMNDSSLTVESVSEAVGFESSAYFRRVFKSVTGYSPRQYRKISSEL